MSQRRCFLCSSKGDSKKVMHGFPKDTTTRSAWIKFCGLNEATDDVSKLYLCSLHFLISDYNHPQAKEVGSVQKLKPGSIPSILKVMPPKKHKFDPAAESNEAPSKQIAKLNPDIIYPGEGTSQIAGHSETPKKQLQPSRAGKSPDVSTPRRAKRCLFDATTKVKRQRVQIRTLQQKNRRLEQRCRTLKDMLNHLKKKNLISEDCQDTLGRLSWPPPLKIFR